MSPQGSANLRTAEEDVEYILVKGKNALIFDFFLSETLNICYVKPFLQFSQKRKLIQIVIDFIEILTS